MKSFNRLIAAAAAFIALIFIAANLITGGGEDSKNRPYLVEISRLCREIEEKGLDDTDFSGCQYVTGAEVFDSGFQESESGYAVREIDGRLYRFDYDVPRNNGRLRLAVNVIIGIMSAALLGILFYIRSRLVAPFERLRSVPEELAKGNLTAPLKQEKSRYFGKFVWGLDLLRENLESRKKRELDLQREKKLLLLSLSHDIKTPLSAIKLSAKALSRGLYTEEEKKRQVAENINAKADEIEEYLTRIVTAARDEFLSFEVKECEFYLSELTKRLCGYYKEKLELTKTRLYIGDFDDVILSGDIDRAEEVMQNFVENAVKYGDGREIRISFSEEEDCRLVTVTNGGCTLSAEELPGIFDSFCRGKNAANISGSGLGLYICRKLMQKMNGDTYAELHGSEFSVTAVFAKVS